MSKGHTLGTVFTERGKKKNKKKIVGPQGSRGKNHVSPTKRPPSTTNGKRGSGGQGLLTEVEGGKEEYGSVVIRLGRGWGGQKT